MTDSVNNAESWAEHMRSEFVTMDGGCFRP